MMETMSQVIVGGQLIKNESGWARYTWTGTRGAGAGNPTGIRGAGTQENRGGTRGASTKGTPHHTGRRRRGTAMNHGGEKDTAG